MKLNKLFIGLSLLGLLVSCGEVPSSSASVNNPNDDGTITTEDKSFPNVNDEFEFDDFTGYEYNEGKWYSNRLKDMQLPDPYVLTVQENGEEVYYIYGTTDRTSSKTLDCYRTTDFNTFKLYRDIDAGNENTWDDGPERSRFAPEVYFIDGLYYLYYSDNHKDNGRRYISVMTSETPYGPFIEYNNGADAVFKHNDTVGWSALDQHVLIDDDGKMYMYYSIYHSEQMQYIVGVELLSPTVADWSTYKILIRPGEASPNTTKTDQYYWEAYKGFKVAEGPFVLKSPNGKYYLTYSVNHYPDRYYTVCYAYSDSPLGDYVKPYTKDGYWTNLLFGYAGGKTGKVYNQWEGFMSGTAHHCFFKSGDQVMIGYHAHKNRKNSDTGRMFAMDYIFFDDEGVPYSRGPTSSVQPLPEAISGYKDITSLADVHVENIENSERLFDNYVVEHYHLAQEQNREATINAGKSYVELVFDVDRVTVGGILIYNSAFYDKAVLEPVSFVNLQNGNACISGEFNEKYINFDQEFIYPGSAFTFDFADVKTDRIVIEFDLENAGQLNEIIVLGYENE